MANLLNQLDIENFRSLRDFHIERLGRVNLIVGKNNAGKSSVLEAIRIYASCAQRDVLQQIAEAHDEKNTVSDDDPESPSLKTELPFSNFFYGRNFPNDEGGRILIGDKCKASDHIRISYMHFEQFRERIVDAADEPRTVIRRVAVDINKTAGEMDGILRKAIVITKDDETYRIFIDGLRGPVRPVDTEDIINCSIVPTSFVSIEDLARDWDNIVFTDYEKIMQKAMRFISPNFEGLVFVESQRRYRYPRDLSLSRIPIVKLRGQSTALPLRSLGDGMLRILQLILKTYAAQNGFLLIDEFENGLHYSIQKEIWDLVFSLAEEMNIQVFATTHSWDCIQSFSAAACDSPHVNGVLFRVGKSARESDNGAVIGTSFSERQLYDIAQSDLEVRG